MAFRTWHNATATRSLIRSAEMPLSLLASLKRDLEIAFLRNLSLCPREAEALPRLDAAPAKKEGPGSESKALLPFGLHAIEWTNQKAA
jgi:hypothetical protein